LPGLTINLASTNQVGNPQGFLKVGYNLAINYTLLAQVLIVKTLYNYLNNLLL